MSILFATNKRYAHIEALQAYAAWKYDFPAIPFSAPEENSRCFGLLTANTHRLYFATSLALVPLLVVRYDVQWCIDSSNAGPVKLSAHAFVHAAGVAFKQYIMQGQQCGNLGARLPGNSKSAIDVKEGDSLVIAVLSCGCHFEKGSS
jgi:hypothetical protein